MLFDEIPPDGGDATVRAAVTAILRRARDLGLLTSRTQWSLSELRSDARDYLWLCEWARQLNYVTARLWLEGTRQVTTAGETDDVPGIAAIGCLLLFVAAEVARREATEGSLWTVVQKNRFENFRTDRLLFIQNNPTQWHKDAMEAAARHFRLRHVFGIEGLMNWFDSVYLQFGFTYKGVQRRLPEWLALGGNSQAVLRLLNGPLASPSFVRLWDGLRLYRRNNIRVEKLRSLIADSSWVLPEWSEDLIQQAVARMKLGMGAASASSEDEGMPIRFVTEPALRWNHPDKPAFCCRVCNLADQDLEEASYTIYVAGEPCVQLLRQPDETYATLPSEEIAIRSLTPTVVANLVSASGRLVQSCTLNLWDANEDVNIFRLPGGQRLTDGDRDILRTGATYAALHAADLVLSPESSVWCHITSGLRLALLPGGWSTQTQILYGGQPLWKPRLGTEPASKEPPWASSITMHVQGTTGVLRWGDAFHIRVRHPEDTEVTCARCCADPVEIVSTEAGQTVLGPIVLQPGMPVEAMELTLGLLKGTMPTHVRRCLQRLEVVGAIQYTPYGPVTIDENVVLGAEEARMCAVRVYPPRYWDGRIVLDSRDWAVMEGENWISRLWRNARPLPDLAGFGDGLTVCHGAYNNRGPAVVIAREVVNHGIVSDAQIIECEGGRLLSVYLSNAVAPDAGHKLVWWDETGALTVFGANELAFNASNTIWSVALPPDLTVPVAIGIAYDGVRIGAWWSPNWYAHLPNVTRATAAQTATLVRWMRLPLLGPQAEESVKTFARTHSAQALTAWLAEETTLPQLSYGDADERWLSAVRKIFSGWIPSPKAAAHVILGLASMDPEPEPPSKLLRAARRLLRVDPILLGRMADLWVTHVAVPQRGRDAGQKSIERVLLFLSGARSLHQVPSIQADLQQEVAETLAVDPGFVERGLVDRGVRAFRGESILPFDERNLALASTLEPFRRLLAIRIVEPLYRGR